MVRDAIASHLLIYIPSTIGPNKGSIRGSMSASNKPLRDLRFVRRTRLVLFTRAIISPTSRPRLALAELELYIKVILALVVVVVVVFTLKTVLTSIQYPSLSYSSRQRNEFPWSHANPK